VSLFGSGMDLGLEVSSPDIVEPQALFVLLVAWIIGGGGTLPISVYLLCSVRGPGDGLQG
jgi:hypothetical protein